MAPRSTSRTPKRMFYKIGEVCELTSTEPYVLRYWESEFPFLAPEKNKSGQRIYSDEDIQTVLAIKRLLYQEGYTTAGARRRLEKELADRKAGRPPATDAPVEEPVAVRAVPAEEASADAPGPLRDALLEVRTGLREIRSLLSESPSSDAATPGPRLRRRE